MDEMGWEAMLGRQIEWLHIHPFSGMDDAQKSLELRSLIFQAAGMLYDLTRSMTPGKEEQGHDRTA